MIAFRHLTLLFLFTLSALLFTNCGENRVFNMEDKAVQEFNIDHFMGNWHQVALLCQEKKSKMEAVTLEASMDSKGIIHLFLKGHKFTPYGPARELTGKGKWNEKKPAVIRSTFFLNFYRDYYILHAEEDNSVFIISNHTGTRLHVLSRHPSLSSAEIESIRNKVQALGYDPGELRWAETYF